MKNINITKAATITITSLLLVSGILSQGAVVNASIQNDEIPATPPTLPIPANHPPRILNSRLPVGIVNKPYRKFIQVIDVDGDNVKVAVKYLPKGIKVTKRITRQDGKGRTMVYLAITGRPVKSGFYKVLVIAKDEHGAVTRKNLKLTIRGRIASPHDPVPTIIAPILSPAK